MVLAGSSTQACMSTQARGWPGPGLRESAARQGEGPEEAMHVMAPN